MTEQRYEVPITSFESGAKVEPVVWVKIMEEGREALERINGERGLGFDDFDLDFYTELFKYTVEEDGLMSDFIKTHLVYTCVHSFDTNVQHTLFLTPELHTTLHHQMTKGKTRP
eukprot:scaffold13326_cov204-Alexandrium_tamarense.AAC.2